MDYYIYSFFFSTNHHIVFVLGANIDAYARQYLWRVGLDYRHGTGHGIGHYLSIHEGMNTLI